MLLEGTFGFLAGYPTVSLCIQVILEHPAWSCLMLMIKENYFPATGVGVSVSRITVLSCWSFVLCFCWIYLVPQTYLIVAIYLHLPLGKSTKLIWSVFFSRNLHNSLLIFTYLLMLREQSFIFLSGWFRQQVVLYLTALCIVYVCLTGAMCKLHSRESNPCVTNETLGLCTSIYFCFSMASEEEK